MLSRITRQLSEMRTALNTPLHGLFKYLSHSLFYHIVRLCQGLSLSLHLKNHSLLFTGSRKHLLFPAKKSDSGVRLNHSRSEFFMV